MAFDRPKPDEIDKRFSAWLIEPESAYPIDVLRELLTKRPSLLEKFPLWFIVNSMKSSVVVKELLSHGANVHSANYDNYTALHMACYHTNMFEHQFSVIKTILEAGAEVNIVGVDGRTPLCVLMQELSNQQLIEIAHLLLPKASKFTLDGSLNQVLYNFVPYTGCLEEAKCKKRHLNGMKIAEIFLERGATPDIKLLKDTILKLPRFEFNNHCVESLKKLAKLLIKYAILKKIENIYIIREQFLSHPSDFSANELPEEIRDFRTVVNEFLNGCVNEMALMQKDKISYKLTLFQHVQEFCLNGNSKIALSNDESLEIVSRWQKNVYRKYNDVICSSIKHSELVNLETSLRALQMSGAYNIVKLNPDCFRVIASYLSKIDLINFMIAFYDILQN